MSDAAARSAPPRAAPAFERASTADWLAVAAGALGAMMATLDISIVNSSLPTIQGEIGASGSEGTWISTSYLVAEIVIIPLAGWLERLLGLRTLLLIATSLFVSFSMLCGLSDTLPMMIVGRIGQGFTGGALIPTAMTIIATRLPTQQQPIGNAMFGVTVVLGPVVGPVLGGWLTENLSWHYAFFINLPVGVTLLTLLAVALPHRAPDWDQLRYADWAGIAGLALGLGGLTVVLEEGQREQWFASAEIRWLALTAVIGFALIFWGQARATKPVIRLRLLLDRQFSAVVIMVMAIGMVMYGTSYVIPQFLSAIAGYDSLQSAQVVLLSGLPMILMMPFTPFLMRTVDIRIAVITGMSILAISAYLETGLTSESTGSAFAESQVLRGLGTIFASIFMNQAAIRSVPREMASDAAGLYNTARNLGGSLALAAIGMIQDQRIWLHSRRIEESLRANDAGVQTYLAAQAQTLGSTEAAYRALDGTIRIQAMTMTYADLFWIVTVAIVCVTPLALLLRPLPQGAPMAGAH
ncbi:DHA2 family efflux MFS transporter permease subunit [Sphingomonas jatrophae]|uniref:MFS transporter, DHA2 family, multidrug resistance protein n=1 Tax=Sphingomonas jatrophae TaxID=1166337 RepID=A0A1I6KJC9_9SPHN|nr:DHA2 family efflux MFS transporter permease subunit [Sphingomonas jatrophae]SFR91352.1 MFS transporter, DHA2 family, multidrug resistance protein [Sphingomonas jatrophae]